MKRNTLLVVIIVTATLSWGQAVASKGYHDYQYRLVKVFEDGNGPQALGYAAKDGATQNVFGPMGLRHLARDQWQVLDRGNGRLVWMDESFAAVRNEKSSLDGFSYLSPAGDFALRFFYGGEEIGLTIVAQDNLARQIFVVTDEAQQVRQIAAVMNEGAIFVQNDKKAWSSLPFTQTGLPPGSDGQLWDVARTSAELRPSGEWGRRGFAIDPSGNLLYKGLVLGNRYDVYLSVYDGLRDYYPRTAKPDLDPAERYLDNSRFSLFYRGLDSNRNAYWAMGANEAVVFDASGSVFESLTARGYEATKALVLHPSGALYQYGTYTKLFVVDNVWDPKAAKLWEQGVDPPTLLADVSLGTFQIPVGLWWQGELSNSAVRMRMKPTLEGKIITTLQKDTPVTVLDVTPEKMKIGNVEAPWYLVRTWQGTQGWIYGAYLDIQH